ncbi:hypothetical protein HPB47_001630 [Ixodes persulcatus]|uniref:Uncharacterized protein n=1 Tax=Ixodes persulcatus TaxID=34615 RepID=A0AC60PNG1_IXOPE|nr:hypothetical protein HPB47_001630 [Ixodes persulcatus]
MDSLAYKVAFSNSLRTFMAPHCDIRQCGDAGKSGTERASESEPALQQPASFHGPPVLDGRHLQGSHQGPGQQPYNYWRSRQDVDVVGDFEVIDCHQEDDACCCYGAPVVAPPSTGGDNGPGRRQEHRASRVTLLTTVLAAYSQLSSSQHRSTVPRSSTVDTSRVPIEVRDNNLTTTDPSTKKKKKISWTDDTAPDGTRVIVFATVESLGHLLQSPTVLCDGTFKTVPRQFYQLYTFHGVKVIGGSTVTLPLVYSLLSSKTETAYLHLFNKTGIQTLYVNDATFASSVRQLCALSFLPSHRIRRGYEEIKPSFPAQAAALHKWFEKNYVVGKPRTLPNGLVVRAPPKFPPDLWSVHPLMNQGQPRGNNSVESWHARFLKVVGRAHPGIWKFLVCMAAEHKATEDKLERMLRSQEPPRQKKTTKKKERKDRSSVPKSTQHERTGFSQSDCSPSQALKSVHL